MSSMTMIVVVQSETDKPTGWGVEKLTELNENSDHFGNMYSEINHSQLGEYTVHLCLIIKLVGWNISFYVDTYRYIKSDGRSELPRNIWSVRLPRQFLGVWFPNNYWDTRLSKVTSHP